MKSRTVRVRPRFDPRFVRWLFHFRSNCTAEAARRGADFGVEVPLVNRAALDFLFGRGFRMDSFFALFMSDVPFGRFDRYLFTSPPFFL